MKRSAVLLMLLCFMTLAPAHALQITDERGVNVTFAQTPQRIVSLLPSLTESICALGQCQRLVGVDRYSTIPPACAACRCWAAVSTRTSKASSR